MVRLSLSEIKISCILFCLLWVQATCVAQTVTLPIDFEANTVINSDFLNFDGGTATVIPNPFPVGSNTSATVGRMVRNGGQPWAGAYLTTPANVNFSTNPFICMQVYTTAPVGTRVSFKMEGCGGPCSHEVEAFTTVSGEWETLCYDFTGQPTSFNRLVFLFNLGTVGNGSASSTFYFDDIEHLAELPLFLTPGSEVFCPDVSLTLNFTGPGTYNWYSDPEGTILVQAGSSTYTTPLLSASTSYYVRDMSSSPFPATYIGPSIPGGTAIGNSLTTSTFFTSNLDNGFFHSVDMIMHIPTGPVPSNTCTYKVDAINLTQGTSRSLTQGFGSPVNFSRRTFIFPTPLPVFLNDELELRITSLTGHPCYCTSSGAGDNGLFLPFPNSYDPQITFTGHSSNASPNVLMSGLNYRLSGDFIDPTLFQVNAIADCDVVLPVELIQFSVEEDKGEALIMWTTASEINNSHFIVMRSKDGIAFEHLTTLHGAGNSSSILDYSCRDKTPLNGLSFYRLNQVDFDGTETLSHPIPFTMSLDDGFKLFPNPTDGIITLSNMHSSGSLRRIMLSDLSGRKLIEAIATQSTGPYVQNIDLTDLPNGIYILSLHSQEDIQVFRVIKD